MKTISLSSLECTNSFRLITSTTSYICVTYHKNSRWVLKLCLNFSFRLIHISPESLPLPRWRRPTVSWTSVQSVTLRLKCRRSKRGMRRTQTTLSTTLSACRIILNWLQTVMLQTALFGFTVLPCLVYEIVTLLRGSLPCLLAGTGCSDMGCEQWLRWRYRGVFRRRSLQ